MKSPTKPSLLKVPLVEIPLSSFPYSLIGTKNKGIRAKLRCVYFLLRLHFEKRGQSLHCEKSQKDDSLLTVDINLRTKWRDKISSLRDLILVWRAASVLRKLKSTVNKMPSLRGFTQLNQTPHLSYQ